MATGDKYPVLMASQLGSANGPAQLNPDGVLPYTQGGTENKTPQSVISSLGCLPQDNLLKNWDFTNPVNQIGQSQYSTNFGYSIDRWYIGSIGLAVNVVSGGITLSGYSGATLFFNQPLSDLNLATGTPLCLSLMANNQILTGIVQIPDVGTDSDVPGSLDNALSIKLYRSSSAGLVTCSIRLDGETDYILQYVKLENAPQQTLSVDNGNGSFTLLPQPQRNELLLCQKYQLAISETIYLRAQFINTTTIFFELPVPTTLKKNPTFSGESGLQIIDFASGETQTGFTFSCYAYPGTIHIVATKATHGLTDASLMIPSGIFSAN